jgi:hypothetical protein
MKTARFAAATFVLFHLTVSRNLVNGAPFDGKTFNGRIAYSADGNYNDEDDWAASPVALAIFAAFGVKNKLVHFDYNSILTGTNAEWEKTNEASVLGAARRYGYRKAVFHDSRKDLTASIESIRKAIDASSADDPLYFIVAGPMQVAYLGIRKSDPAKRKFVYVISHSRWNDGFDLKTTFPHNKRSIIPLGVKWVQIADQNKFLSTTPFGRAALEEEWQPWLWMRDSKDPSVRFLWDRLRVSTKADCSDAGMAYFLMTGDEISEITKLRKLLDDHIVPTPIEWRKYIRVEAENFLAFDNYEIDYQHDPDLSHRIGTKLTGSTGGRIRTTFDQPFIASIGRYDVQVRYLDQKGGRSKHTFYVNGIPQGDSWIASHDDDRWRSQTIPDVNIRSGDEITVEVQGDSGEFGRLDCVHFNYKGPSSASRSGAAVDDARALPGQVIVAGANPGYLKYNGGGPVFPFRT